MGQGARQNIPVHNYTVNHTHTHTNARAARTHTQPRAPLGRGACNSRAAHGPDRPMCGGSRDTGRLSSARSAEAGRTSPQQRRCPLSTRKPAPGQCEHDKRELSTYLYLPAYSCCLSASSLCYGRARILLFPGICAFSWRGGASGTAMPCRASRAGGHAATDARPQPRTVGKDAERTRKGLGRDVERTQKGREAHPPDTLCPPGSRRGCALGVWADGGNDVSGGACPPGSRHGFTCRVFRVCVLGVRG